MSRHRKVSNADLVQKDRLSYNKKYIQPFLEHSSIHGFRYLLPKEGRPERLIWLVAIFIMFLFAALNIQDAFVSWDESPTVTSVDIVSINSIQFPDITICSKLSTHWQVVMDQLNQVDPGEGVFQLFRSSQMLKTLLAKAVERAGVFLLVRDFTPKLDAKMISRFQAEDILDNMCSEREQNDAILKVVGTLFEQFKGRNYSESFFKSKRSAMMQNAIAEKVNGTLFYSNGTSNDVCKNMTEDGIELILPFAQEILLYKSLDKSHLFVLLMRLLILPPEDLQQVLIKDNRTILESEAEMQKIYKYISGQTRQSPKFRKLPPLPVALQLMNLKNTPGKDYIRDIFSKPPDPFNPNHVRNFDLAEWNQAYNTFQDCLFTNRNHTSSSCKFTDDLFRLNPNNGSIMNHHSSFNKSLTDLASPPLVPFCRWRSHYVGMSGKNFDLPFDDNVCDKMDKFDSFAPDCFVIRPGKIQARKSMYGISTEEGVVLVIDRGPAFQSGPPIEVVVHAPGQYPDLLELISQKVKVREGFTTTILLDVMMFEETNDHTKLPLAKRKCLTEEERARMKLHFFDTYSYNTCLVDYINLATIIFCNCTYTSHPRIPTVETCLPSGQLCRSDSLNKMMNDDDMDTYYTNEICPEVCAGQYFIATITKQEPIVKHSEARKDSPVYKYLFDWIHQDYMTYVDFGLKVEENLFEDRLNKLAVVNINFGKAFVQKNTMDSKANFSTVLSTIGGTLGLFTGFSIVSVFEIVYWIFKAIGRRP